MGGRRMRVGRRRTSRGPKLWVIALVLVLLAGAGVGAYFYFQRPEAVESIPNPAVVAPGGFRADIGDDNTITVGLEVRNTANLPVTLIEARVIAPVGLTSTALTIIPPGPENEGFALDGPLPAAVPVQLGTDEGHRNAIVAARFTVNCDGLATNGVLGEQIFVTIQIGGIQREEELTPPVVGDGEPWLSGTARRVCLDPVPTSSPEAPLPPLPEQSGTPSPSAS